MIGLCPLLPLSGLSERPAVCPLLEAKRTYDAGRSRSSPPLLTQSGHEQATFAAMHGPDLLYLARDPWSWGTPHEAARVHIAARRRCGVLAGRSVFNESRLSASRSVSFPSSACMHA